MKKALVVTLLSIGTVMSSAVAAFVYSSSTLEETNIMVKVASYDKFVSTNNSSDINVNGEFKLIIGQNIETYCTINASCINNNNDSILDDNYAGSYYFNFDTTYDSYFNFTNYEGNFKNGIIIDSPLVTWKNNMYPITDEDYSNLRSTLKDKEIRIIFKAFDN